MVAKRKKKSLKKTLRQITHPIPSEKVEDSEAKYNRRRGKKETEEEIDREAGEQ